tara:strand:- start:61424 stop:62200 length:777 start_codon:yes stop_codon:yes gene_type:complete
MSHSLLVVDVGNTQTVLGIYENNKLKASWRLETKLHHTEDELAVTVHQLFMLDGIATSLVDDIIISSVVPPQLPQLVRFCKKIFDIEPLLVIPGIKTGLSIKVDNPREVGADRIANAAGGLALYNPPLILVDFGTAITVDAISSQSEYLGGTIIPGIGISLNALNKKAAKLPKVEISKPPSIVGKNTVHAIQAGAYYGYGSLVDGVVSKMKTTLDGSVTVIATGGEASLIATASSTIEHVEENLTLIGLHSIYKKAQS